MSNIKRSRSAGLKAKVALELIRGTETIASICSRYGIHQTQAGKWKQRVVESMESAFSDKRSDEVKNKNEIIDELHRQIGQMKVELDWLKKNLILSESDSKL